MGFKKGNQLGRLNKGSKRTEESKAKMRKAKEKNCAKFWLGKKHSEETKRKISNSKKGQIPWSKEQKGIHLSPKSEFKKGYTPWNKGKIVDAIRGENHWNWQGGKTPVSRLLRNSLEYALWRTAVLMRDNYTCQECGQRGGKLEVDHIKPFALYPELIFAIDNGRTLCIYCHRQTNTYGGKTRLEAKP